NEVKRVWKCIAKAGHTDYTVNPATNVVSSWPSRLRTTILQDLGGGETFIVRHKLRIAGSNPAESYGTCSESPKINMNILLLTVSDFHENVIPRKKSYFCHSLRESLCP
ncbi:hypothetical protein L9F63_020675, partial [Diploptera punctata]